MYVLYSMDGWMHRSYVRPCNNHMIEDPGFDRTPGAGSLLLVFLRFPVGNQLCPRLETAYLGTGLN